MKCFCNFVGVITDVKDYPISRAYVNCEIEKNNKCKRFRIAVYRSLRLAIFIKIQLIF